MLSLAHAPAQVRGSWRNELRAVTPSGVAGSEAFFSWGGRIILSCCLDLCAAGLIGPY